MSDDKNKAYENLEYFYLLENPSVKDWIKVMESKEALKQDSEALANNGMPEKYKIIGALGAEDISGVVHYFKQADHITTKFEISKNDNSFIKLSKDVALLYLIEASKFFKKYRLYDGKEWKDVGFIRGYFSFSKVGIMPGEEIIFTPRNLAVKVADDRHIEYEGKLYLTSPFVTEFMPDDMRNTTSYRGPNFFTYKGETLTERRDRLEGHDSSKSKRK